MWDENNPPIIQPDVPNDPGGSSSVVVTNKIGGSGNKGKIIAALLGVLLLVAGVGAGLVLVNQQQLINQKAAGDQCAVGSQPDCRAGQVYLCLGSIQDGYSWNSVAGSCCNGYELSTNTNSCISKTSNLCPSGGSPTYGAGGCTTGYVSTGICNAVTTQSCTCCRAGGGGQEIPADTGTTGTDTSSGGTTGGTSGGGGGGAAAPVATPRPKYCGETCSQNSDCSTTTSGGVQPVCNPTSRLCVNPDCPTDTNYGSICSCGSLTVRTCGQTCGQQKDGTTPSANCGPNAVCGNSASSGGDGNNYCLPTNNSDYLTKGGTCGLDPNPGLFCIKKTDGTVVNTQAQIITACNLVTQSAQAAAATPTPTPTPTASSVATVATTTPTQQPIPVSGFSIPTIMGIGMGIFLTLGGIILIL